jgi:hypothetical protein
MAGFGRFKLTDALPEQTMDIETSESQQGAQPAAPRSTGKGKGKGRSRTASARSKAAAGAGLAAEQVREAQETNQAKNAEGSIRDRMVDIGRGNQQAGRQRAK